MVAVPIAAESKGKVAEEFKEVMGGYTISMYVNKEVEPELTGLSSASDNHTELAMEDTNKNCRIIWEKSTAQDAFKRI